jgi:hypothetical protein
LCNCSTCCCLACARGSTDATNTVRATSSITKLFHDVVDINLAPLIWSCALCSSKINLATEESITTVLYPKIHNNENKVALLIFASVSSLRVVASETKKITAIGGQRLFPRQTHKHQKVTSRYTECQRLPWINLPHLPFLPAAAMLQK